MVSVFEYVIFFFQAEDGILDLVVWSSDVCSSDLHRDPEPRLHIPIITNPGCLMVIDNVAKHMPADGSVWITNNTKYHNAFNGGEENRIHLVACVLDYKFS